MADIDKDLVKELVKFFLSEEYAIVSAMGQEGYPQPSPLRNDGYGDQEEKYPEVMAYDKAEKRFAIGVIKQRGDDLESAHSLTQYDVYFDHRNPENGKSSRVCFLLPPDVIPQFTGVITHYIHPEYWENMTIISSKLSHQDS